MVSNTHTARVSIRSLSAPNLWAYILWETSSSPAVRGTVEWAGKPDLGLVALVLNDYVRTKANSYPNPPLVTPPVTPPGNL